MDSVEIQQRLNKQLKTKKLILIKCLDSLLN